MTIVFHKYEGTGNDFIIVHDPYRIISGGMNASRISHLCHRAFGIGSDGLIFIHNHPDADFEMKFYNPDGKEGSMCGNGGRCAVSFSHNIGITSNSVVGFYAADGFHEAMIVESAIKKSQISLKMADVQEIKVDSDFCFLNTGSPHHVAFVEDVENTDVLGKGREIRFHPTYAPTGTNVNFVQKLDKSTIFVRTFERGVENETLSCGTGVTASALASHQCGIIPDTNEIEVRTRGGNLKVAFSKGEKTSYHNIHLIGPATSVFKGEIDI